MLRVALLLILFVVLGRTFWRVIDGLVEGITGRTRTDVPQQGVPQQGVPQQGVPMVRDPVCGTFVLPERAVSLSDGRTRLFFCSDACRDKYRARSA
jgi:YHS domain-containing protein